MKRYWKVIVLTLLLTAVGFLASSNGPLGVFWRPAEGLPRPVGIQVPLLVALSLIESVAFGLGVSFLIFGYALLKSVTPATKGLTLGAHLSISWLLINWWPHDNLHIHNGDELNGLIGIEYGFHVSLIIAGMILARFLLVTLRREKVAT